ncbi:PIN domain-containing protein [Pseudomonas sp. GL-B-26]|uniref:PIN domain-containing protein n=1 Tax=Pseudomonas sp. GL-B-26 TaxID=2832394 RepID=UPI001CBEACAD|nr:PIN domain-containing protein [Pseudomonas sp. GL-B-26]
MEAAVVEKFDLKSRYLFIDTSIYHAANYQFFASDLQAVTRLLEDDKLTLLFTSITVSEVKRHLKNQVTDAVNAARSLRDKGKVLRNLPSFSQTFVFRGIEREVVENELFALFEKFMATKNIEMVSLDLASAEVVFENYFSLLPPFSEKKTEEFRDAFVLESLKSYAIENGIRIHVLSTDGDMRDYCSGEFHLLWSDNLGKFVNSAVHLTRVEPAAFADKAFLAVEQEVYSRLIEYLEHQDFGVLEEGGGSYRVTSCEIENVVGSNRRVLEVSRESTKYALDYEFEVAYEYFQSEPLRVLPDGSTIIEISNNSARYKKVAEAVVFLSYFEGDLDSVKLEDYRFGLPSGDILWEDERTHYTTTKVDAI